jgi:ubiquinone/menaquinone biosynthesis C-methylase UbiE
VLSYHRGSRNNAIDLGCGHGVVARFLSPSFTTVKGIDPSEGMLAKARSLSTDSTKNITYHTGNATTLGVSDHSVDLVLVGQAAHWFPYPAAFTALHKALRPGGTLAFFGYKDPVFPHYPRASKILDDYAYGEDKLGPHWPQPGRSIVQNKLRDIVPPTTPADKGGKESLWEAVTRIEYEPGTNGPNSGEG